MIKLEPFNPADFDKLISWIDSRELLVTIAGTVFSYPLTVEQLQTYLQDKNSYSFSIAEQSNSKTIGHAELAVAGKDTYKIDKLIIGDKSNRGKGVGQEVINQLLNYAFIKLHAKTVELNVFDWNTAGIKCYEKCGFTVNPGRQATFQVDDKNWIALNMTIERGKWAEKKSSR